MAAAAGAAVGGTDGGATFPNGGLSGLSGGATGCGLRFLPSDRSNAPVFNVGIGISGCAGTVVSVSGSTMVGVTTTTNSVVEWFTFFDLNSAPRIGILAAPGVLLRMSVVRWSRRPEIAKLWLSRSSTSVSALRVESAGTVNPLMETELE